MQIIILVANSGAKQRIALDLVCMHMGNNTLTQAKAGALNNFFNSVFIAENVKPEPNMPKFLPVIPSSTSQKNYPLFFKLAITYSPIPLLRIATHSPYIHCSTDK